jgi:hypothetical protein
MKNSLFAFLLLGFGLSGQGKRIVPIETFPVKATLINLLEGTLDRALLRIENVESNQFGLEVGDTIICTFYFSTQSVNDGVANFAGVGPMDKIRIHLSAVSSPLTGTFQYQGFHYVNTSRPRLTERSEVLSND